MLMLKLLRETNKQKRRLLENNRLPEERYTRTLKKLKEEGKLDFNKPADKSGCCNAWKINDSFEI